MLKTYNKTPFPYWGGKSDAAEAVWEALGDVVHYVEPFAGSLAVLLRRPHPTNRPYHSETVNDLDGLLCVGPETRILRSDLRWQTAGETKVGDELLAFDEHNGPPQSSPRDPSRPYLQPPQRMRRWNITRVINVHRVLRQAYRLRFEDGTVVVASEDHLWLAGKSKTGGRGARWVETKNMRADASDYRTHVMKLCDVVTQEVTAEAGWVGGFYDGEGNIRGTGAGWRMTVCQKLGPEADRVEKWLVDHQFQVARIVRQRENPNHQPVAVFEFNGGMRETLRFLMHTRPERLIRNALSRVHQRSIYARERQVVGLVEKTPLGMVEVMAIETESHTYVAEGLASHNCNAWRGIAYAPDEVAHHASWPVSEADLMARHLALVAWKNEKNVERLMADPDFYDAKMAGWWVWGSSSWIGSGWCTGTGSWTVGADGRIFKTSRRSERVSRQIPHVSTNGQGVSHPNSRGGGVSRQVPHLSKDGQGVNVPGVREEGVSRQLPHMGNDGRGVNAHQLREQGVSRQLPRVSEDGVGINAHRNREPGVSRQIPHISDSGQGVNRPQAREEGVEADGDFHPMTMPETLNWMRFLSARLRHVRIINGSWERVCTSGVLKTLSVRQKAGVAGVFLDPPYDNDVRTEGLYAHDSGHVATDAREWCKANGDDPMYRIVLAGYDTEHSVLETLGWRVVEWYKPGFLKGGMGNQSEKGTSQRRERLWLSPHCLNPSDAPKITSMDDLFGF